MKTIAPRKRRSAARPESYLLKLYVSGGTARSTRSILNLRGICDKYLAGRYKLEVIDIYQQPELAAQGQVIAAPTLVKRLPLPLRRLVGDFSDAERVIKGLSITTAGLSATPANQV
jgi:circadian clock protein KaiB